MYVCVCIVCVSAVGLEAMQYAMKVEKEGYQSLLDLHKIANDHHDYDVGHTSTLDMSTITWIWNLKKISEITTCSLIKRQP